MSASEGDTTAAMPGDDRGEELVGRRIGEFRLLRLIGRGGMGSVYEANQDSMRRRVALKLLNAGLALSESEVVRFEREAWIGGRLSHPCIVKVYGQGTEGSIRYIAMELVEGTSLHEEIRRLRSNRPSGSSSNSSDGSDHVRRMVSLFVGVADALHHVHECGIVHRDIKPGNLLLSTDGQRLLITDFGLAKDEEGSQLTRRGDLLGTIRYMSPEQLLASRIPVDRRSDIYSAGVSLYEAVTLALPFHGESEEAYITSVSTKDPIPARKIVAAISRDLEAVLMKCVERDPDHRYASAAELRDDLECILHQLPVRARRKNPLFFVSRWIRRQRRILAWGAALGLVLAGIAIVGRLGWEQSHERQRKLAGIRDALEEGLPRGRYPREVLPNWEESRNLLEQEVRHDPKSAGALLAHRAAVTVAANVPKFGLVSNPPSLEYGVFIDSLLLNPCGGLVILEASWDRMPWRTVHWVFNETIAWRRPLASVVGPGSLTPSPHTLKLRCIIRYYDRSFLRGVVSRDSIDGSGEIPASVVGRHLSEEIRSLGSYALTLYEEYPQDFPRVAKAVEGPVEQWFRVDRVCLEHLSSGGVRRIVLVGRFDMNTPYHLSAEATLLDSAGRAVLPSFPFIFAPPVIAVGAGQAYSKYFMFVENPSGVSDSLDGWQTRDPSWPAQMERFQPDGEIAGRLIFEPSREVALMAKRLDDYFGETVSSSVTIELKTVPAPP